MGLYLAAYCPGRMSEHSKWKSTGGFLRPEWSPCTQDKKVIFVLESVVLSVEPAVEGAPAIVLLLDDVLQAVDDQLVELDGGVALATALLGAEVPVVQLK